MIEILNNVSGKKAVFTLCDSGEALGKCECSSEADYFLIEELDCPLPFYESMARAALNYAAQNGLVQTSRGADIGSEKPRLSNYRATD